MDNRLSFNMACDQKLDEITVQLSEARVTDEKEIKILTENAAMLRKAKRFGKGKLWDWVTSLSLRDILMLTFSVGMYKYILDREDEGVVATSRSLNWSPFSRFPRL